jgi:hypothetical protein
LRDYFLRGEHACRYCSDVGRCQLNHLLCFHCKLAPNFFILILRDSNLIQLFGIVRCFYWLG